METTNKKIGNHGEWIARMYLRLHGYRILCKNYVAGKNEIDIVAATLKTIAFVEVKTRTYTSKNEIESNPPRDKVDADKQYHTARGAESYLRKHKTRKTPRMDVIEVALDKNNYKKILKVTHIKNAY